MLAVTWNILSLRDIVRQLALAGFGVSKDTVTVSPYGIYDIAVGRVGVGGHQS